MLKYIGFMKINFISFVLTWLLEFFKLHTWLMLYFFWAAQFLKIFMKCCLP